jgi:transposase
MRGDERIQDGMFSYVSLEHRVPADHPLRAVRKLTDAVLRSLSAELDAQYADSGRPSIAPEYILRALLLQVFYSVRSEPLLVEQIDYNLLFRWFVGLGMDDAVWNHAVFSKNRDRLLTSDVAQQFFAEVNKQAKRFMSDEHFTVDGTLIQAWASQKSFRSKDDSDDGDGGDFHGQKRSNETHQSTTYPDARLYKKSYGKESKLSYLGHALVENRNGLIAAAMVTHSDGYAERDAALLMLAEKQQGRSRRITVGADKAYDSKDFVRTVREMDVTPHITRNENGHGNDYTLELQEVSGDPNASFDSTVFLIPADKDAQKKMAEAPVFVPAAEVKEKEDRLEKEIAEAQSKASVDRKAAQDAQEKYASTYPSNLDFDYSWDQGKARALGVKQIWDDGKFSLSSIGLAGVDSYDRALEPAAKAKNTYLQ